MIHNRLFPITFVPNHSNFTAISTLQYCPTQHWTLKKCINHKRQPNQWNHPWSSLFSKRPGTCPLVVNSHLSPIKILPSTQGSTCIPLIFASRLPARTPCFSAGLSLITSTTKRFGESLGVSRTTRILQLQFLVVFRISTWNNSGAAVDNYWSSSIKSISTCLMLIHFWSNKSCNFGRICRPFRSHGSVEYGTQVLDRLALGLIFHWTRITGRAVATEVNSTYLLYIFLFLELLKVIIVSFQRALKWKCQLVKVKSKQQKYHWSCNIRIQQSKVQSEMPN